MRPMPTSSGSDEELVGSILQDYEDAWNRRDLKAFAALFNEDADFVSALGARWIGRRAIREAHDAPTFKASQITIGDTTVRFIAAEVAVTRSRWSLTGLTDPAGRPLPPCEGFLTHVLTKKSGSWGIAVSQDTDIAPVK
jgi:uncharacterized protein (TIGR02246 family)